MKNFSNFLLLYKFYEQFWLFYFIHGMNLIYLTLFFMQKLRLKKVSFKTERPQCRQAHGQAWNLELSLYNDSLARCSPGAGVSGGVTKDHIMKTALPDSTVPPLSIQLEAVVC